MFSKTITSSARFLKMPVDSQNLYFHLGMNADDDGVVEAFSIMRAVGSNEDNLKVLASRNFVKILNEDLVTFITDWREHNLIRADRKVNSIHRKLLLQIVPEIELIKQKPRADTGKPTGEPSGRPMDAEWTAQVRLGKDSLGEVRTEREGADAPSGGKPPRSVPKKFIPPTVSEIREYLKEKQITSFAPEQFHAFYASKGWMVGKNKMVDWHGAVETWRRRKEEDSRAGPKNEPKLFRSRDAFLESIPEEMRDEFFKNGTISEIKHKEIKHDA
jgi:hypothetical protein